MIEPLKKNNLYEAISKQIIKFITDDNWKPGSKIPTEMELSKKFGVSRNSIREAVKALELIGLLTSKTGKGTFVAENAISSIQNLKLGSLIDSESTLIELMEARLIVEPGLVEIATSKMNEEDLTKLSGILKQSQNLLKEDVYSFYQGFLFHREIIRIADNKILDQFINNITDQLVNARKAVFLKRFKSYNLESEIEEHIEIFEHMKNKDGKKASKCMYVHIEKAMTALKHD